MAGKVRQTARYLEPASSSRWRLAVAAEVMPDGITRETIRRAPLAPWMAHAHGTRLVDADGDERADFVFNHTALVHGHTYEPVVTAVTRQLKALEAVSFPNAREADLARLLAARSPVREAYFRFTSSGSEAVLLAVRLAQAETQRRQVVVFEHCYHGGFIPGSDRAVPSGDFLICPFDDAARLRALFAAHGADIAAVLADLCPVRGALCRASEEFAAAIGESCERYGALLVADEVVSSRAAPGGMVLQYGLEPDIACFGKYIGGGLPIGAVAFRRRLARAFAPDHWPALGHGGTYNGNPLSMAAGCVAMRDFDAAAVGRMDATAAALCEELTRLFARHSSDWTVRRAGSLFHLWPHRDLPRAPQEAQQDGKARQAIRELSQFVLNHGAIIAPSGFGCVATVTSSADIDELVLALNAYLAQC
jgi:glutamate-1-semialdehyde 2,1-aminomutase